jgi:hypothetical protein
MKLLKSLTLLLAAALLLVPATADADGEQTLTGEYQWDQGGASGDLKAVFTPTGEGTYDVSFYFNFRGRPHTYTGTAKGSLTDGGLEGTVENDNKRRTFTFQGTAEGGRFSGTHAEITSGDEYRTGTLQLGV